jgi:hypothetical protein
MSVDQGMGEEKVLRLSRRLESLHLPLSAPSRPMRVLGSIVEVATLPMLDIGQKLTLRNSITLQLVRDDDARRIVQTFQQPLEEALRSGGISAALHEDIEHDPVLVDSPPEITLLAVDPDENLIHVPLVPRPRPAAAQIVREARAEFETPPPNALVGDNHAPLRQDQLNVTKAQAEHVIEPHRVADELSRETVAVVRTGRLLHPVIFAEVDVPRQLA